MSKISAVENLYCAEKWVKIHQNHFRTRYPLKPPIMPNFIEIGETTLEKSVTKFFTPFNILAQKGVTLGKRSRWWGTSTPQATCKSSSSSDDPSPRYLLPNFVDFVAGVTNKNIQSINQSINQ